ncbi:N-acetylmuramoyl-L-alanine amidase family protein [Caproicibacterium sp. BJN0003]|uniref:peptidoglycan recognition protein family protein n=1 Tax=Caproicibacterium sp. BJN0003 TaxID=2994078 RepID=UPI002B1CD4D5|nr:N-acetylmuramoyl-L-alanine amidase [Caproicibacterium sp. BJN0003]
MDIIQMLCPPEKYGIKCPYPMAPTRIVIHNTYNDASARNEIAYMIGNNNECSFHYAVDDQEVVQGIPENRNAWHAGDGNGPGNRQGIAIEICYSLSGGERFDVAERSGAQLAAMLLNKYGWGIDRLTKHQDYMDKYCPHRTLDRGWGRFVEMVQSYMSGNTPSDIVSAASSPIDNTGKVSAAYRVRTKEDGWLSEIWDDNDFGGVRGHKITDVAIGVTQGAIRYRVHVCGSDWLPWVTGYDINDDNNGYAGNGQEIDAIEVYYYSPAGMCPLRCAHYKVSPNLQSWYEEQIDDNTGDGMDGFSGKYGNTIDRFQMTVA